MPQRRHLGKTLYNSAPLLLLTTLSLFALAPLFASGYFYDAHDGRHGVFYLLQFDASIQDGAYWPRWAMHHNQGYGYPTFLIQAPLGFYVAEIFVLLGAGYTTAVKWTWALGFLVSGWGMYALVVHWLREATISTRIRLAGVIAGLVYVYSPYHLVDAYVRAALSDTLLLAWFPWVLLAFDKLIVGGTNSGWTKRLAATILLLAGTLLTHSFALLSFTPFVITFVLFRLWLAYKENVGTRKALLRRTVLAAAGGVGAILLAAIFILPLLVEGPLLQSDVYVTRTYDFRSHFVYFGQFFSPFWGFGFSDDPLGSNDGMSFQIGLFSVLTAIVSLSIFAKNFRTTSQRIEVGQKIFAVYSILLYLLVMSALTLFTMTPAARVLWESIPPLAVIQFPWRLLSLSALTFSALAGIALHFVVLQIPVPHTHLEIQRWGRNLQDSMYLQKSEQNNAGLLLVGLLAIFASVGYIDVNLSPIEPWREDGRAIARFENEHPDMFGYTQYVQDEFTTSPMSAQYLSDEYVEEYGENGFLKRLAILAEDGSEDRLGESEVLSQYSRGSSAGGIVRLSEAATVRIHVYYFPGWHVRVDGELAAHRVSNPHGLIEVDLPTGEHRIDARFGSTPVRRVGAVLSILMGLVVVGLILWKNN